MLGREIKQGDGWSDWAISDQAVTEDFMEEVAVMPNSGGGAFQKEGTARARLPLITATCGLSECGLLLLSTLPHVLSPISAP